MRCLVEPDRNSILHHLLSMFSSSANPFPLPPGDSSHANRWTERELDCVHFERGDGTPSYGDESFGRMTGM